MVRVLVLHDSNADFETSRSVKVLTEKIGPGFEVKTQSIGAEGTYPHLGLAAYRLRGLRGEFDVVHAWGTRALMAAGMGSGLPVVYSPPAVVSGKAIGWARAVRACRKMEVICPTATSRRLHIERGMSAEGVHLIRPGVDFSRFKGRGDRELKKRLGFSESDRVILAVGEQTVASHHAAAVWATGILNVLDKRYKILVWGRGRQTRYLKHLAGKLKQAQMLVVAEETLAPPVEFEELLAVADVAMVTAQGQVATLPICMAMAGAVPIVSSVSYTTGELLEDRYTALMVAKPLPKLLAKRVSDLYDTAHGSIADRARAEAYEHFPLTRFLNQYRTVYRQVAAGEKVNISGPQTPAHLIVA